MRQREPNGFTLIELVLVLIVIAILSASVILRGSAKTSRDVITDADRLQQNIAHMQMLAMTWGVPLRLTLAPDGTNYWVSCRATTSSLPANAGCPSAGATPIDPATGDNFKVSLSTGAIVFAPILSNGTVTKTYGNVLDFDSLGRPVNASTLLSANPLIPADPLLPPNPAVRLVVSGGSKVATVSVYPITGFAEVN